VSSRWLGFCHVVYYIPEPIPVVRFSEGNAIRLTEINLFDPADHLDSLAYDAFRPADHTLGRCSLPAEISVTVDVEIGCHPHIGRLAVLASPTTATLFPSILSASCLDEMMGGVCARSPGPAAASFAFSTAPGSTKPFTWTTWSGQGGPIRSFGQVPESLTSYILCKESAAQRAAKAASIDLLGLARIIVAFRYDT